MKTHLQPLTGFTNLLQPAEYLHIQTSEWRGVLWYSKQLVNNGNNKSENYTDYIETAGMLLWTKTYNNFRLSHANVLQNLQYLHVHKFTLKNI